MNKWDQRYNQKEFIYGTEPNEFVKSQLSNLKPGNILFPGEGEGRNSVFAAKKDWKVHAFDSSEVAQKKALDYAKKENVKINYIVSDYENFTFAENYFDAIALTYTHIFPVERKAFHSKIQKFLKKDGVIIMEMFSKKQINNNSGGPRNIELLYSLDELKQDFTEMKIIMAEEKQINLSEGNHHSGIAEVIRFVAQKF